MSTSPGAAPPDTAPRRSARVGRGSPLLGREPSRPSSAASTVGTGDPSPLPRRSPRGASPTRRERDDVLPPVVISDDNQLEQPGEKEMNNQRKEDVEVQEKEVDEDLEVLEELPGWLPDGWIMEVRRDDNGSTYRYYTSPVSGYTFSTKMETLHYLFSEMDERMVTSQECPDDNQLHTMHTWLPNGWIIEVRAGGRKMDKMYKFYVHLPTGMRFFSKENVLLYVNEGKISRCDVKGLCDTSSEDNILSQVEFHPDGLPEGWVKETIFRKCNDGIRKDPYYTDPVSHHVFRTLKTVMSYLETGEMTKHAYIPRRSVTDMYTFHKCTELPENMRRRLKLQAETKRKSMGVSVIDKKLPNSQTTKHCASSDLDPQSDPEQREFVIDKEEALTSDIVKRPRGRPRKIIKQTTEGTKHVNAIGKAAVTSEAIKRSRAEGGTSCSLNTQSAPKENKFKDLKATGEKSNSSENIKRPRGRPRKVLKQTTESTSDCAKNSHNETEHIVVKDESDTGGEECLPNEKKLEYTEMKKHSMVVVHQGVNKRNTTANRLSTMKRDRVHKFYKRRRSNATMDLKTG